jgi:hypothetical protein
MEKNVLRKKIFSSIFFLFIILLSGCQLKQINAQKSCHTSCLKAYEYCRPLCKDSCPNCCGKSYSRALSAYHHYVNEKNITGDPSINLLQSFDDHLKCNKNSCNCQADYILCKQACEGKITKRLKTFKPC